MQDVIFTYFSVLSSSVVIIFVHFHDIGLSLPCRLTLVAVLGDITTKIAIYHHCGDITQYKSLFHYGEPSFLAYLGLPLPEGGIKSWSRG